MTDIADLSSAQPPGPPRTSYTMSLTFGMLHKIDQAAQTLGTNRSDLIETLLELGLKHYLDVQANPAHKPVKTLRDLLLDTARRVRQQDERLGRLEGTRGIQ